MQDGTNGQPVVGLPGNDQDNNIQPPIVSGAGMVSQPTPEALKSAVVVDVQHGQTAQQPKPARVVHDNRVQFGISASQMGLNEYKAANTQHTLLKPIAIFVVLAALIGAGFFIHNRVTGYTLKTVQAAGFKYTVVYSKRSTELTVSGNQYLQGTDQLRQTMLLYVSKAARPEQDCYQTSGGNVTVITTPIIEGQRHNLCYTHSLNDYTMNFTHHDAWYSLTLSPQDKSEVLDQETVIMVASSIIVST